MTWILPKQLHTSASALDTEALISDLNEQSQICARSLFLRSKVSPARTWLLKFKRDSWTQHLFGRILKPSLGQSFVAAWTSSLAVTHANHSPQQESDLAPTIPVTSGLSSQMELKSCDLNFVFSKTSRDTSAWDSEQSSRNWEASVIKQRGEYSARVKLAHLTNVSGYSFWPSEVRQGFQDRSRGKKGSQESLTTAVMLLGLPAPANPSADGSRQESWLTPRANEPSTDNNFVARNADRGEHCHVSLTSQAKAWETPTVSTGAHQQADGSMTPKLDQQVKQWAKPIVGDSHLASTPEVAAKRLAEGKVTLSRQNAGKLNPRWVETLMGLPVGWTMPSCVSPVTIAPTNSDCSETELSPQPQLELS